MNSRLRIRIGEVELEYEGTEEFLKKELPQLLKTAMSLRGAGCEVESGHAGKKGAAEGASGTGRTFEGTTASIAAKIGAKSGPDLIRAAAAHLTLVKRTERFSRSQLLKEMQSAASYYKSSFSPNLTKYLKTAIQAEGPLSEVATDTYALKAKARAALEKVLADD